MSSIYKSANVYEEAIKRINMVFDYKDDIIVTMSGGKDSTTVFNLALNIARERNRLPLKVMWLDQEVEWQNTVDYMNEIMHMPEVKPFWFQIPFEFPNNLAVADGKESLLIWDPAQKGKWVHPQSDIAITECPFEFDIYSSRDKAFYTLMDKLPDYCADKDATSCGVLSGMRAVESLQRRTAIMYGSATFRGETWARKASAGTKCQVCWPIYDFTSDDVWTAIAKNHWKYNKCYDLMYRYGVRKDRMRVSALIHETAWGAIETLQTFEKDTYNRLSARVSGVSTFAHLFDFKSAGTNLGHGNIVPQELPFMFADWKEYRDYLLEHLIEPKYWEKYRNEWRNQEGENWYRVHVKEVVLNDTCGTINESWDRTVNLRERRANGEFRERDKEDYKNFIAFMEGENGN